MEIWGQIPGVYTISLTSPGGESIPEIPYRMGQSLEFSFVYSESRVVIDYVPVDLGNGQELITLRFIRPVPGIWKIRVFAGNGEGIVHSWLPLRQFLKSETYFLRSSPYETITEPAYSRATLAVSSYNSADQSFYLNSGRGFSVDGSIVPSIAAPGVLVPTVMGAETGSSMAAAITAGAAADFMQWAVVEGRDITINTQFDGLAQVTSFAQFVQTSAQKYLPTGANLDINIQTVDEQQAVVTRTNGKFNSHVYNAD